MGLNNNYIAWEGKLSSMIETIASSADWSAMVTGPAMQHWVKAQTEIKSIRQNEKG